MKNVLNNIRKFLSQKLFFLGLIFLILTQFLLGVIYDQSPVLAASVQAIISFDEPSWLNSTNGQSAIYPAVSLTRGYAPLPVFFQGFKSFPREEIIDYVWNFGDGNAYEKNPNTFHGLNAAHVYETPGRYTATLTVYDRFGSSDSTSVEIEVLAPNGKIYWVAEEGDDNWTGLCQNPPSNPEIDNCGPWRTGTKAFVGTTNKFYQPGDQIIFKRGQTFAVSATASIPHYKGGYGYTFRADSGSGPKPILQWTATTNGYMISQTGQNWGHIGFVDLEVRLRFAASADAANAGGLVFAAARGRSFLFLRVDFKQARNSAILIEGSTADSPSGTFFIDSTVINSQVYPETSVQLYYKGSNLALLNSTFDLSGNHSAYLAKVDKGVIANNIFSRPAFGRAALRLSGVGGIADPTNNVQVSDNRMLGWIDPETSGSAHNGGGQNYHWRLVNLSPNITGDQLIKDIIFERNVLTNCNGCLNVANADNIIIRNNLFVTPGNNKYVDRIEIGAQGSVNHTLPVRNLKIIGNTFVTGGQADSVTGTSFIKVINFSGGETVLGSQHSDIKIDNNIFYLKPGTTARVIRFDTNDANLIDAIQSDYNVFYLPDAAADSWYEYSPCVSKTGGGWDCSPRVTENFSQWQARTGNDSHSIVADPKFSLPPSLNQHLPGYPDSWTSANQEASSYINDLVVAADSPAIDAGSSNYPADLYYDFSRNIRPQGFGFDIGAYELIPTTPPPPPTIEFLQLPISGDENGGAFATGKIHQAHPATQKLAIYLKVAGVWYPKPNTQSLLDIAPDGSFSAWIMTAPSDFNASAVAAYLVPVGTIVPNCWLEPCFEQPVISEALATALTTLSPNLSPNIQINIIPDVLVNNPYLAGRTSGIDFNQFKVMAYIRVASVWYPKPNVDFLSLINSDGSWQTLAVTHQNDWQATDYKVFVVPNGTDVPDYWPEVRLDEPNVPEAVTSAFKSLD